MAYRVTRRDFIAKATLAGAGAMFVNSSNSSVLASPKAAKSILLSSGWQTINIGDVGHTPGTLRYLREHIPEAKVTLWLSSYNDAILSMLKNRFPEVNIIEANATNAGVAVQQAFDEADMFIQNSGMKFNQFWKPPVEVIKRSIDAKVAFCLYGQSFDGFKPDNEPEMSELLSNASQIYCRDNESFFYLRKIGTRPDILGFGPDGCFGIDVKDEAKAEAYLDQAGLKSKEYITVTIRTNTPKSGTASVLNPKEPTNEEKAQDALWAGKLREVMQYWVKETGRKVLLVPEVDKEIPHAKRLLWEPLPSDVQKHVVHRSSFWNVDEAAAIYARAHTVVSMEPHSCIIALANGTPVLHLFSPKHGLKAWMFRDIGLPEWLYNIEQDTADDFSKALLEIHQDYGGAEAKVRRAMNFVHTRSEEMMRNIRRTIGLSS